MPDIRSESDTTSVGFLDIYNDYYNKKSKYIYNLPTKCAAAQKTVHFEIDTFLKAT